MHIALTGIQLIEYKTIHKLLQQSQDQPTFTENQGETQIKKLPIVPSTRIFTG